MSKCRYNPNETAWGGGIYDENDRRIARVENQRLNNAEISQRAVGRMMAQNMDKLEPPMALSPPSFDFFGTPKAMMTWLGLNFGLNWHTAVGIITFLGLGLGSANTIIQV